MTMRDYSHDQVRLDAVRRLLAMSTCRPPIPVALSPLSREEREQKKAALRIAYHQHLLLHRRGDL